MNEQEEIYEQAPEPRWKVAVRRWYDKIHDDYISSGADQSYELTVKYAAIVNWSPCHYCTGLCGDGGVEDYDDDPDPAIFIPFPWEKADVTECTYCPVRILQLLHHLRPERNYDHSEADFGSCAFIPGTTIMMKDYAAMLAATPLGGHPTPVPGQVPTQVVPQPLPQMPSQNYGTFGPEEEQPF